MARPLGAFALVCSILLVVSTVEAGILGKFDEAYVFGDSFSDNGNVAFLTPEREMSPYTDLVPDRPYDISDRFSNDAVWTDLVGLSPSFPSGTNYAVGGAESGPLTGVTPEPGEISILQQVQNLFIPSLGGGSASSEALYVVAPVGNDLRRALEVYLTTLGAGGTVSDAEAEVALILMDAVNNVATIIDLLSDVGAEDFLVFKGGDIGLAPAVAALDASLPSVPVSLIATGLAASYNAMLDAMLDSLLFDVARLDIFGLLNQITADPGAFGLTDPTNSCITPTVGACSNPDNYLFWDGIHLTAAGQDILANAVRAEVVPTPATSALLMIGLAGLWRQRNAQAGRP